MTDEWNPSDPDATRVLYDLSRWSFDQRAELAAELAEAAIPHTWDGDELVVPEDQEAAADAIIGALEARLGISYEDREDDDSGVDEFADEEAPPVAPIAIGDEPATEYDLTDWPEGERLAVTRAVVRQSIPHRWEQKLLVVPTEHEEVVESLLDMIENTGVAVVDEFEVADPDDEGDDSSLPFETLTMFFLAAERLQRDPLDADGLEHLLQAVDVADPARPPYGVDMHLWRRTCELTDELAAALADADEPDHEMAIAIATDLHDVLRPYI